MVEVSGWASGPDNLIKDYAASRQMPNVLEPRWREITDNVSQAGEFLPDIKALNYPRLRAENNSAAHCCVLSKDLSDQLVKRYAPAFFDPRKGRELTTVFDDQKEAAEIVAETLGTNCTDEARMALQDAYAVARANMAPFLVKISNDMLVRLRQEVAESPQRKIVFLGRDGHGLATAARELDPQFFAQHCTEVVLSRALVEKALLDLEKNLGFKFDQIKDFRGRPEKLNSEDIDHAYFKLTKYLQKNGIPIDKEGSQISLVDTSYKGTVQELLSAIYPKVSFQGHYAFFGESPYDPHPGSKRGYVVELDRNASAGGRPIHCFSESHNRTFCHQEAIGTIEATMHGAFSSPKRFGSFGPEQYPQHLDPNSIKGLNPLRVSPRYDDPFIREGVKRINHHAIADYASHLSQLSKKSLDWRHSLGEQSGHYAARVRRWILGNNSDLDPRFVEIMDSFVPRLDKAIINSIRESIDRANLTSAETQDLWRKYSQLVSLEEKRAFAKRLMTERVSPQD